MRDQNHASKYADAGSTPTQDATPYRNRFVLSPLLHRLGDTPQKESDLRDCSPPKIADGYDCHGNPCRCFDMTAALQELERLGLAWGVDGWWARTDKGRRVAAGLVVMQCDHDVRDRAQQIDQPSRLWSKQ